MSNWKSGSCRYNAKRAGRMSSVDDVLRSNDMSDFGPSEDAPDLAPRDQEMEVLAKKIW